MFLQADLCSCTQLNAIIEDSADGTERCSSNLHIPRDFMSSTEAYKEVAFQPTEQQFLVPELRNARELYGNWAPYYVSVTFSKESMYIPQVIPPHIKKWHF